MNKEKITFWKWIKNGIANFYKTAVEDFKYMRYFIIFFVCSVLFLFVLSFFIYLSKYWYICIPIWGFSIFLVEIYVIYKQDVENNG